MGKFALLVGLGLILILFVNCDQEGPSIDDGRVGDSEQLWLDGGNSNTHDFGSVIGTPGKQIQHTFSLKNMSVAPLEIKEIINNKPCCGRITGAKKTLHPGEIVNIDVTLLVGNRFGDVRHETVIVTEPPSPHNIVLLAFAKVYPMIRIEEIALGNRSEHAPDRMRDVEYLTSSFGTTSETPIDLAHLKLVSDLSARWLAPKQLETGVDGIRSETRRFSVTLASDGFPGIKRSSVSLCSGERVVHEQTVSWEVLPTIRVVPRILVLKPNVSDYTLVLSTADRSAFKLVKVISSINDIKSRFEANTSMSTQSVTIQVPRDQTVGTRRGKILFSTDHPNQLTVEIPIVSAD